MHTLRECILCGRVVVFQADYIVILISHSKLRFIVFAWLRCSKQDMEQLPVSKLTTEDDSVIRVFHHSVAFGHVSVSFHLCQCSFSLFLCLLQPCPCCGQAKSRLQFHRISSWATLRSWLLAMNANSSR